MAEAETVLQRAIQIFADDLEVQIQAREGLRRLKGDVLRPEVLV